MKGVINDIRGHHFLLGENKNDFKTTTGSNYVYNSDSAISAKCSLDAELKSDLRSTHYKLGYMPDYHQTTHQSNFIPHKLNSNSIIHPNFRKSNIDLSSKNRNVFDGKTIYMTDFNNQIVTD